MAGITTGGVNQRLQAITNVPSLPVPLEFGSLSWSDSFEQHPTGTITYKGVKNSDVNAVASAYPVGKILDVEGIGLVVTGTETKPVAHANGTIVLYEVTVSLGGKWQTKCEQSIYLKPLANKYGLVSIFQLAASVGVPYFGGAFNISVADKQAMTLSEALNAVSRVQGGYVCFSEANGISIKYWSAGGGSWSFSRSDVIENGGQGTGVTPAYTGVEITGPFTTLDVGAKVEEKRPNSTVPQFVPVEPFVDVRVEGADASDMPEGTTVLKDMTSVFDNSGPKKVFKRTTLVDKVPVKEEIEIYGFVYYALDLATIDPSDGSIVEFWNFQPRQFWKQIEYRITEYIYEPIAASLNIQITDPDTGRPMHTIVHPEYKQFVKWVGGTIDFKNTTYLTRVKTTGWKLARFQKETDNSNGEYPSIFVLDTTDAEGTNDILYTARLVTFNKIPIEDNQAFELGSVRKLYGDTTLPFQVNYTKYSEAEALIKAELPLRKKDREPDVIDDYKVAVLTPDPNYVEPMIKLVESRMVSGFDSTPDLAHNPLNPPDPDIPASPPLTTGEESYYKTERTILKAGAKHDRCGRPIPTPDSYLELVTQDSAQDPGFKAVSQGAESKLVSDRPPAADVKKQRWEKQDPCDHQPQLTVPPSVALEKKYYVFSDGKGKNPTDSLTFPAALTKNQAILAAKTQLEIETTQATQNNHTLAWYYPRMRAGDRYFNGGDAHRVLSVSWSLEARGRNNAVPGGMLIKSGGTQLSFGANAYRYVRMTEEDVPVQNTDNTKQEIAGNVRTNFLFLPTKIGSVVQPDFKHRRNF